MLYNILMCISYFTFFSYNLLLAVYFIFMLVKGNKVTQKVNSNLSDFF